MLFQKYGCSKTSEFNSSKITLRVPVKQPISPSFSLRLGSIQLHMGSHVMPSNEMVSLVKQIKRILIAFIRIFILILTHVIVIFCCCESWTFFTSDRTISIVAIFKRQDLNSIPVGNAKDAHALARCVIQLL